ncbi:hypothetical protein [Algoriphagus boritolerans]|uniref:hypothetical protein n=1 Tax=Algoriphagus boritolerans TaxID=308111 RepID=UPI000ABC6317
MTDWENGMQVFYPEVTSPKEGQEVEVSILDKGTVVGSFRGQANKPLPVRLQNPKTWSPDDPFLYDVSIKIFEGKKVVDQVKSYAAYRDIRMAKDQNGHQRMFLNGKPLFQYGPLDQGWWLMDFTLPRQMKPCYLTSRRQKKWDSI